MLFTLKDGPSCTKILDFFLYCIAFLPVLSFFKVLSNKKFKSATHRVVRKGEKSRYSFVFFYNLNGEKWIEPLPQFTKEIGEAPKYRGFLYKEYQELRLRNKTHPPSRPEDVIHITHYAIDT